MHGLIPGVGGAEESEDERERIAEQTREAKLSEILKKTSGKEVSFVSLCVCVCVCVCVCLLYVCMYACIHAHTHTHAHTERHVHAF